MTERKVTVRNYPGIHAHPAVLFVKKAGTFRAEVTVSNGELSVNGKSIMGVLLLAASQGAEVRIVCEGTGAAEALAAIVKLFEAGFYEL